MRVRGKSLVEISREVGYTLNYWSRLENWSPLYRDRMNFLKALNDELWLRDVERRYVEESGLVKLLSKQRKKNKKKREGREMTPFVAERIVERAAKAAQSQSAAPTQAGQIKKDGMVNGGLPQRETRVLRRPDVSTPRLQPAMSQSRMPAGQVPPSRQSWQDLIAKRKAETAWQSRDGTSGRR